MSYQDQAHWLAERLEAEIEPTGNFDTFNLQLKEIFPLHTTGYSFYFLPTKISIDEIITQLEQQHISNKIKVIITLKPIQSQSLLNQNLTHSYVVADNQALTKLLLSPKPLLEFVQLLVGQLKTIQPISPYQTHQGITKDTAFFGRVPILTRILQEEPANYLVIGGRQVGKSSLLAKINRYYQKRTDVDCHYIVLSDPNLAAHLKNRFELPKETSLADLREQLSHVNHGQRRLFLIDEADLFIQNEIANDYPTLNAFRGLSEEGACFFIFAGFWELYKASILDYFSPLKNFGQSITVGELEIEACHQLIREPMALLDIHYESEQLVERIISETGQRANLMTLICDEMLKNLANGQRILTENEVTQALQSWTFKEALSGWTCLTSDQTAARLDRIVVYATVGMGFFKLTDIMKVLDESDYDYTTEQLNQSLKRLDLAFIIRHEKQHYSYRVPLFRAMLMEQQEEIASLLNKELRTSN